MRRENEHTKLPRSNARRTGVQDEDAGSIAEIETLRTTLLIEIADVAVNGG